MTTGTILRALAAALALLTLSACVTVQPWQRGTLARDDMRPGGEPALAAFDDHTYFSKEASSGGRSFGGGGCGCN
ncbi:MAG: DUF4266 domain-containing protein [Sinimarinibacterium flocculans]|uniref:Uncharacterized protein DUF4266 n=1 Tax=Sinimarinibacterium flocculans TaxID=985250 RepID=A0A318EII2_9GAMM|nr:DUF4266 domain-containing protein [Sinimarinibacterium flocculans]PXV70629.1 uncharacterized protein DUF4266 [Sinimarinibacterium flocculans]